jgi:PPM family protein phosphatase
MRYSLDGMANDEKPFSEEAGNAAGTLQGTQGNVPPHDEDTRGVLIAPASFVNSRAEIKGDDTTINSPTIEGIVRLSANGVSDTTPRLLTFPGGPIIATRSAQGKRKSNQDALIRTEIVPGRAYLIGVADGMGGYAGGEQASAIAVHAVERLAVALRDSLPADDEAAIRYLREQVVTAFADAQNEIETMAAAEAHLSQMGTTMVLAGFVGKRYFLANLGDSRGYRLNAKGFHQVTEDHTVENDALRLNTPLHLDTPQAKKMARALTRALRPATPHEPEFFPPTDEALYYIAEDGDTLILCSDGLGGVVPPAVIGRQIQDAENIEAALKSLEKDSLERGSTDNISAAIVVFGERVRKSPMVRDLVAAPAPPTLGPTMLPPSLRENKSLPPAPESPVAPVPSMPAMAAPIMTPPPPATAPIPLSGTASIPMGSAPSAVNTPLPLPTPPIMGRIEPPRMPVTAFIAVIVAAVTGIALIFISLGMPDAKAVQPAAKINGKAAAKPVTEGPATTAP